MKVRRQRPSIGNKILGRALLLSLVPLLVLAAVAVASLVQVQQSVDSAIAETERGLADEVAGRSLRQDAAELGLQYERYLGERVDDILAWSDAPVVQDAATGGDTDEAERFLQRRVLAPGTPFLALALVDTRSSTIIGIDGDVLADPDISWTQPALNEGGFLSPVDLTAEIPYLDVAVRVQSTDGSAIGVLWGALDASFFESVADSYRLEKDSDVDVSVFTREGALLAETASDHDEQRLFDVELERTPEQQVFFDRAVAIEPDVDLSRAESYSEQAGDFAAHGFVQSVPSELRADLQLTADWITEVQVPVDRALAPLAATNQVPSSLDSSVRTVLFAIAAALLLAVLASITVGRILARNIVRPITKLRDEADEVANERLPAAVTAVAAGELPPVAVPIDVGSDDEIGELADSFTAVQQTAMDLATDQALIRRNFSDLFVYLGRRNQNLLGRQLELIESLEREEDNPELLGSLFGLDHLATRMRRNAESLLVIAGREPTRTWSDPVPVRDVIRAASSEVEDYARVRIGQFTDAHLRGEAVSDIAHLVAELLENALQYSPPSAPVTVCGQPYRDGAFAISIADRGLGLSPEELVRLNADLEETASAAEPDAIPTDSLGLFVVARLARRYRCQVRLTGTDEGVVAWVLLPPDLLAEAPAAIEGRQPPSPPQSPPARAIEAAPVSTPTTPVTPSGDSDQSDDSDSSDESSVPAQPAALVRRPNSMADALTLRPAGDGPGLSEPEVPAQPLAGGGAADPAEPRTAGRTPSGFTRRVSRSRRLEGQTPREVPAPVEPASPPVRRSADDVGSRLSAFQAAVEQGRAEASTDDPDTDDRGVPPQGDST